MLNWKFRITRFLMPGGQGSSLPWTLRTRFWDRDPGTRLETSKPYYSSLTRVDGLKLTFDLENGTILYSVYTLTRNILTLSYALRKCHYKEVEFLDDLFCFDNPVEVDFRIEWAQSHPQLIQPSHKMQIVLYVVQYILFQSQHGALSRFTKMTQKPKPEVATDQNRKSNTEIILKRP